MDGTCTYSLTMSSFSRSIDLHHFFVIRSVFLIPFNLGLPYLVHTLMMEGKNGGSTVSTGSTVKCVLRGHSW